MIWDSVNDPVGIGEAVFPGWLRLLVSGFEGQRFPVSVGGNVQAKAWRVFDAFQQLKLAYDWEPPESHPGKQKIRPLNEVVSQRRGTCVDLCAAFACAALDARLHPLILVIKQGQHRHAIVLIPVDKTWEGGCLPVIQAPYFTDSPDGLEGGAHYLLTAQKPGDLSANWLAIDVQQATERQATWSQALEFGASYADPNGQWEWEVCIDVGAIAAQRGPDANVPSVLKAADALAPAFTALPDDPSPLQLLNSRHGVVPYCKNTHYTALREWASTPSAPIGSASKPDFSIALLEGSGGAGKTRLAAELCKDMGSLGWVTGFTTQTTPLTDQDLDGLKELGTELLLVVDYAEKYNQDQIARIVRALNQRTAPTRLLLAGRSVTSWWDAIEHNILQDNPSIRSIHKANKLGPYRESSFLYRRALTAFAETLHKSTYDAPTTSTDLSESTTEIPAHVFDGASALTVSLYALLEAVGQTPISSTAKERSADNSEDAAGTDKVQTTLFQRILDLEFARWQKHDSLSNASKISLKHAAATVALLAPTTGYLEDVLGRLPEWEHNHQERTRFAELLTTVLIPTREGNQVRLEPDPIADYLVSDVFTSEPTLLNQILPHQPQNKNRNSVQPRLVTEQEQALRTNSKAQASNACQTITRLSTAYSVAATELAEACLHYRPHMWKAAFETALTQGGPFTITLQALVENNADLPLETILNAIPLGHSWLRQLALQIAQKLTDQPHQTPAQYAGRLNNLAARLAETGNHQAALTTIQKAVAIRRELAAQNPAAYNPNLAGALNNLATFLADTGNHPAALTTAQEAAGLYRKLATQNPAAYTPGLAGALNNLGNFLAETGNQPAALTTAQEAADLYRKLAAQNPVAYTPGLAGALNNLGNFLAETGNQPAALTTAQEAADLYRKLAAQNPAAYNPDLARALNNLATRLAETGNHPAALTTIQEAADLYRKLAAQNPAAYNPDLAASLNNLASLQAATGNHQAALTTIQEAVAIRRELAAQNPAAYTPDLAMALNNLALRLAETGNHQEALTTIEEAVDLYRQLAAQNLAACTPDLAGALNNLALRLAETGNHQEALTTIEEAVDLYRDLAAQNPAAYNPSLAMALNNLANLLAETGNHPAALTTAQEAAAIRRELATQNPDAYNPDLAASLNNLAARQAETGNHQAALTTIQEAVDLYRQLAAQNPAAYNPDLTMALNNLAAFQAETGNHPAALTTIEEAVDLYRKLATQNPAAYNPNLAGALNNLAARLAETGNHPAALTTAQEAVAIRRDLAAQNPAAYTPGLAMALNNLGNFLAETGNHPAALTTAQEAVAIRRDLAAQNPAAYTPGLAGALNNLAILLAETGNHPAALTTIQEAADLYHQLATQNPAAYNPNLAASLNNLALRLAETGNHPAALTTIQEAVDLYRALAAHNPAAYNPNLAGALNNLAARLAETGNHPAALTTAQEAADLYSGLAATYPQVFAPRLLSATRFLANELRELGRSTDARNVFTPEIDELPSYVRAQLLLARARWGESTATTDLVAAALEADKHDHPDMLGPTRRAVATAIREHGISSPSLPDWARVTPTEEQTQKLARWNNAQNLEERAETLESDWAEPTSQDVFTLKTIAKLYVDIPDIASLSVFVEEIAVRGIEAVTNELRTLNRAYQILAAWRTAQITNTIPAFLQTYNTPNYAPVPVELQNLQTPQIRDAVLVLAEQHLNPDAHTELETALTLSDLCEPRLTAALLGSINDAADALEILFKNKNWQAQALALTRLPELEGTHYGTFAAALATAHQGNNPGQATKLLETAWNRADQYDRQQILANLTAAVAQAPHMTSFASLLARAHELSARTPRVFTHQRHDT